jgi:Na+/proline symporter
MPQKSLIGRVLLQMLGVGAYFALVAILYWWRLTDGGAVAIILGLLFLFKTVIDSGAISLAHLSPSDRESNVRQPAIEILKALSFLGLGLGAFVDLSRAVQTGLVPATLPAAVIHLMLVCICAICVACCLVRFTVALRNRPG